MQNTHRAKRDSLTFKTLANKIIIIKRVFSDALVMHKDSNSLFVIFKGLSLRAVHESSPLQKAGSLGRRDMELWKRLTDKYLVIVASEQCFKHRSIS